MLFPKGNILANTQRSIERHNVQWTKETCLNAREIPSWEIMVHISKNVKGWFHLVVLRKMATDERLHLWSQDEQIESSVWFYE